jgi:hypothetical protein
LIYKDLAPSLALSGLLALSEETPFEDVKIPDSWHLAGGKGDQRAKT